jgi:hypothetical protein
MIFAEFFSVLGPYVAVARPSEGAENMDLGAAKLFMRDDDWRDGVLELVRISAAIVVEAGDSKGLEWEMEQLIIESSPRRVLLIMPRTKREYKAFYKSAHAIFPKGLPESAPGSRLLAFHDDWRPMPLENPSLILDDALEPFCERINFDVKRNRPLRVLNSCHSLGAASSPFRRSIPPQLSA